MRVAGARRWSRSGPLVIAGCARRRRSIVDLACTPLFDHQWTHSNTDHLPPGSGGRIAPHDRHFRTPSPIDPRSGVALVVRPSLQTLKRRSHSPISVRTPSVADAVLSTDPSTCDHRSQSGGVGARLRSDAPIVDRACWSRSIADTAPSAFFDHHHPHRNFDLVRARPSCHVAARTASAPERRSRSLADGNPRRAEPAVAGLRPVCHDPHAHRPVPRVRRRRRRARHAGGVARAALPADLSRRVRAGGPRSRPRSARPRSWRARRGPRRGGRLRGGRIARRLQRSGRCARRRADAARLPLRRDRGAPHRPRGPTR